MNAANPTPAEIRKPQCIFCGRCLEVCPLFATTGREELSPRAKFALNTALNDPDVDVASKAAIGLVSKCLSCGKCEKACPNKLCAPNMVTELRAANPTLRSAMWGLWVKQAKVLWPMMATLSRFAPNFRYGKLESMLAGLKALDAGQRTTPWLKAVRFKACGQGRKAVVFPGCVASHVQPHWNETAHTLLEGLGFAVQQNPGFTCCATTLGHAGLKEPQRQMQLTNIQAWRDAGRPEIVLFCATCRNGLRGYASEDLGWEAGEQERWAKALTPLSELVTNVDFEIQENAPDRVHYHAPCHGSGAGLDLGFLRSVLGEMLSARGKKNLCCGFGGSLKLSAPELSDQVAKRCIDFYAPQQGEMMLSGCAGCVIQLRAGAPAGVGVGHWLEIIS